MKEKASHITPVPGGVGPLTVACLLGNCVEAFVQAETAKMESRKKKEVKIKIPTPRYFSTDFNFSDIEIAENHQPTPIIDIVKGLAIRVDEFQPHGHYIAKLDVEKIITRLNTSTEDKNKMGNYIIVSGLNPTPLGEGKSTLVLGLSQALHMHPQLQDQRTIAVIRQPSQGPTFGIKGGAAGGGYSQVVPMREFNLHFTGDIHAVTAANNLVAAAIDARVWHEQTQSDDQLWSRICPLMNGEVRNVPLCVRRRCEVIPFIICRNLVLHLLNWTRNSLNVL